MELSLKRASAEGQARPSRRRDALIINKNFSLRDNLNNVETDLQTVLRERDAARERGNILEQEVAALKGSLNNLQIAQDKAVDTMTERTISYIGSLEKVVEITGIDVERLMASSDNIVQREGQGGPFIPINPAEAGGTLLWQEACPS